MRAEHHSRSLVQAPALPTPPSIDPTEDLLDTSAGTFLEAQSGEINDVIGIIGTATMILNRRNPGIERIGAGIVAASTAAGGLNTAIQTRNVIADGGSGAEERGNQRSDAGTIASAATALIPGASFTAISGMGRRPAPRDIATLGLLALNSGVLGYQLIKDGPKIVRGEEDASGYGSILASAGGFVVASHMIRR